MRKPTVLALFFLSGASALMYQVVWMRHLTLIFGSTVYATATVIAGFMGGLAVGSFLFGKVADRARNPLRLYGVLEILIAAMALLFPLMLRIVTPISIWYARASSASHAGVSLLEAVLIIAVLLVPTTLMGGTLPILTKHLTRRFSSLGRNLSLLYGLNTLGAVIGCAAAGFVLVGTVGMRATTWIAAALNLTVGLTALTLGRRAEESGPAEAAHAAPEEEPAEPAWRARLLLVLFFCAGFTALAYEVLWTRILTFLAGGTSYAFTAMLAMYLSGLAVGSILVAPLIDRKPRALEVFCVLELLIGLGVLVTLGLCPAYLAWLGGFLLGDGAPPFSQLATFVMLQIGLSILFVFPITLLMGMAFPVMGKLYARAVRKAGAGVGTMYFADTIGCIGGSLAAGFLLIPRFGALRSLEIMALANLAIGAVAFAAAGSRGKPARFAPARLLALGVVLVPAWFACVHVIPADTFAAVFTAPGSRLVYVNEDIGGTVTIEDYGDHRTISIDGVNVAGTDLKFMTTQKLQAHLAMLLHPDPRRVLQIGFGSGGTAWSITQHPVERVDCVELTAAVLKANDQLRDVNHGVLADPRVSVIVDDARSYLLRCGKTYDVILSDSIHPRRAGNGQLYSVDYFRLCRRCLNPDGIFSAWLPLHGLSLEDYRVAARSLKEVFPHVYVFHSPVGRTEWTIILGMLKPLRIDLDAIAARMERPEVKEDLAQILVANAASLVSTLVLGDANLGQFLGVSRLLNTDDFPYLEYVAPMSGVLQSREELLVPLYAEMVACREPVAPYLADGSPSLRRDADAACAAAEHILKARLLELEQRELSPEATRELGLALQADPGNAVATSLMGR